MIVAELEHNPYLLNTKAKFNSQEPKINSRIEKYYGKPLMDWIEDVPRIFYDEMNGYDFRLDFIGTESDYNELSDLFKRRGIDDTVQLNNKKTLKAPEDKLEDIKKLIKLWSEKPSCIQFDLSDLTDDIGKLTEESYPYFIYGELNYEPTIKYLDALPITAPEIDDLDPSDFENAPFLFYYNPSDAEFRTTLRKLLQKNGAHQNQLFFMSTQDKEQFKRILTDCGVEKPTIVTSCEDQAVMDYINRYHRTATIRDAIERFEEEFDKIQKKLNQMEADIGKNTEQTQNSLSKYNDKLGELKKLLVEINTYPFPDISIFDCAKDSLSVTIKKWKKGKKYEEDEEKASKLANEYAAYIFDEAHKVDDTLKDLYYVTRGKIIAGLGNIYKNYYNTPYNESEANHIPSTAQSFTLPSDLADEFKKLKSTTEDKTRKFPIKKANDAVHVYDLNKWREKAGEIVNPILKQHIDKLEVNLKKFFNEQKNILINCVEQTCSDISKEQKKQLLTSSKEEKLLLKAQEWFNSLKRQLNSLKEE